MSKLEKMNFEKKLAEFAAPTLLGIKCGGLMSLSPNEFDLDANLNLFNGKAFSRGLKMRRLCCCGERSLIYIYHEALLKKHLAIPETARLLKGCGYNDLSPDVCLETLSERIKSQEDFPHEIGIFLGYPIEDVVGFIENKGKNFKLCGCRKVYGNVEKAKRDFENYAKCRNFLSRKLNEGVDIYSALKIS